MKTTYILLTTALCVSLSLPLAAQRQDRPGPQGLGPCPLMKALDLDGDGMLSTEEIANAPESLATLDRNGDGRITPDELGLRRGPGPQVALQAHRRNFGFSRRNAG